MDRTRQTAVPGLASLLGEWRGDNGDNGSVYRQLAGSLVRLIRDGRVPPGTRLPAERRLAADLTVSRTTVAAAYRLLCSSGHAESRHGSGTYTIPSPTAPPPLGGRAAARRLPGRRRTRRAAEGPGHAGDIDLVTASPPAPEPWLSAAVDAASRELGRYAHGHGCLPAGIDALREAVAARYTRRGVPTDPGQILVTGGAADALALVLRELTDPSDRVVVEAPAAPHLIRAVEAAGAHPCPAPLRDDGWDMPAWHSALRAAAPRLACLAPDFQQPTGLLMPEEQRRALLSLAASSGVTLLVDETLADTALDPSAPAPPRLAALDAGSTVVTVDSANTLWSGLRVGWVRAAPELVRTLADRRAAIGLAPPVLEQLVVRRLLDEGVYAEIVTARRTRARASRDALVAALRTRLPDWSFRVPDGGLALWADTGGGPVPELVAGAERGGVRLAPAPGPATDRLLRLPFVQPPDVLAEAVRRIAAHTSRTYRTPPGTSGGPS
ncbi:PLP-dependent aminotransferase family protein [Streptomyces sp. NPDC004562]|uniref:aminotransferase-like domain-containing protein n=1 Tax=Streptomyces sp. NPDC004562 TaxID=3364703 RepID=UPI003683D443